MTDKQIIKPRPICLYQDTCLFLKEKTRVCEDCVHHKNYWSELLARDQAEKIKNLEQECEELKNIINKAKNSKLDLKSFLVGEAVQNEYEQQLDKLKAENEELKKQIDDLLHKPEIQDKILWKIDNEALLGSKDAWIYKLRQALTDIKEIAEKIEDECGYLGFGSCANKAKEQILQIISEVEED